MEPPKDLTSLLIDALEDLIIENYVLRNAIIGHGLTAIQSLLDLAKAEGSDFRLRAQELLAPIREKVRSGEQASPSQLADILKNLPTKGVN